MDVDNSSLSTWLIPRFAWGSLGCYGLVVYLWICDHLLEIWLRREPNGPVPRRLTERVSQPGLWSYMRMIHGILLVVVSVGLLWLGWNWTGWMVQLFLGALVLYVIPVLTAALGQWWGHRRVPWTGWWWRPASVILSLEAVLLEPFELVGRILAPESNGMEGSLNNDNEAPHTGNGELTFRPVTVDDIMIPRTDLTAYSIDTPVAELVRVMVQNRTPWLIVYDVHPDRWVGVLRWEDLMAALRTDPLMPVRKVGFTEPKEIPEGQRLITLWREWVHGDPPVAFVYDEYGEVLGVVRWEDLARSLVQNTVQDAPYDLTRRYFEPRGPNEWIVSGRCPIELFWQFMELPQDELPRETETLAGWVGTIASHLPTVGETLRWNSLELTVLEVREHRLEKIRVIRRTASSEVTLHARESTGR